MIGGHQKVVNNMPKQLKMDFNFVISSLQMKSLRKSRNSVLMLMWIYQWLQRMEQGSLLIDLWSKWQSIWIECWDGI